MAGIINDVITQLGIFDYTVDETKERSQLEFIQKKAETTIRNLTNQKRVPQSLYYVEVDLITALFLKIKKGTGQNDGFGNSESLEAPVASVSEGDTSVSYSTGTVTSQSTLLDNLLTEMTAEGSLFWNQIVSVRKLKW